MRVEFPVGHPYGPYRFCRRAAKDTPGRLGVKVRLNAVPTKHTRESMRIVMLGLAAFCLASSIVREAAAVPVELELAAGATTFASTWRGDFGGGGTLRLGSSFAHVFAIDFQAWEQLASVDRRLDTGLSFGVTGYVPLRVVHPYARLFVLHQHEESLVSVENAPAGVVLGIGSGIRHRAGGGLSLGAEIPFRRDTSGKLTWVMLANATGTWFPDLLGPHLYVGVDVGVGLDFLL